MSFIELEMPKLRHRDSSVYLGDKVRIAFMKLKSKAGKETTLLNLYFGRDVVDKIGFRAGDRVIISIDSECPNVWHVQKHPDRGWKLIALQKSLNPPYRIQISWSREIPGTCDDKYKFVSWDIYQGGLRLFLPGITPEEKQKYFQALKNNMVS